MRFRTAGPVRWTGRLYALSLAATTILPLLAQTPRIDWVRQHGTAAFDQAHAVGYGEFGVYTAGDTMGTFQGQTSSGGKDAFISLHDESGKLKWVRQFGTTAEDVATGVAGDGSGAYVVGYTSGVIVALTGGVDSFIRKYDPNGVVLWTRQFGAVTDDYAWAVATHTSGVYVVGQVDCCSGSLPGQLPTLSTDGYIRKYNGDGTELWTRMISDVNIERALAVAVDDTGVYVAGTTNSNLAGLGGGRDGYIRKYSHDGAVIWTRQFGTLTINGQPATDDVFGIAAGPAGVFVAGATAQGAGPGATFAGGLWDGFVAKFDTAGAVQWYRQIGTDGDDYAYAIALGAGHILVAGGTAGDLVSGAYVGGEDAFIRLYDFDGNILGTRQFGNGLNDSGLGVVAFPGGFFVAGTKSGDALGQQPVGDNDFFAMKVIPPPFVPKDGVLNAASFAPSPAPLAPGSMAVVFGAYLNEGTQVLSPVLDADGKVSTSLGGTQVTVNNVPAPILYSVPGQVAIQIPFEVAGQTTATVSVSVGGQTSIPRSIDIAPTAPGFFTQNLQGTGLAVVLHEDGVTPVTLQNPARRSEIVVFYLTGLGVLNPALGTGVPAGANLSVAQPSMRVGAFTADIQYAGAAPGLVGINQINARLPVAPTQGGEMPVSITVGGRQANAVTIPMAPSPVEVP